MLVCQSWATYYRRGKVVRILMKIQGNSGPSKNIYSYYQGRSIPAVFSRDFKGKIGQRRETIVRIYILTIHLFFTFNGKIRIFRFLLLCPIGMCLHTYVYILQNITLMSTSAGSKPYTSKYTELAMYEGRAIYQYSYRDSYIQGF